MVITPVNWNWKIVLATIDVKDFQLWLKNEKDYGFEKETKQLVDLVISSYLTEKSMKIRNERRKQGYKKQRKTWKEKKDDT